MSSGIDRLETMTIRAASPDQRIQLTLVGGSRFGVAFAPGAYQRYRERELESQLATVASAVWAGHRRARERVLAESIAESAGAVLMEPDGQRRKFQEARARVVASGESPGGAVCVESVGLAQWHLKIVDGTLARLDEREFVREFVGAVGAMRADHRTRMIALKHAFFDLNFEIKDRFGFGSAVY